jgi:hypothetical protein
MTLSFKIVHLKLSKCYRSADNLLGCDLEIMTSKPLAPPHCTDVSYTNFVKKDEKNYNKINQQEL